jgi:hypothetical protein
MRNTKKLERLAIEADYLKYDLLAADAVVEHLQAALFAAIAKAGRLNSRHLRAAAARDEQARKIAGF